MNAALLCPCHADGETHKDAITNAESLSDVTFFLSRI